MSRIALGVGQFSQYTGQYSTVGRGARVLGDGRRHLLKHAHDQPLHYLSAQCLPHFSLR